VDYAIVKHGVVVEKPVWQKIENAKIVKWLSAQDVIKNIQRMIAVLNAAVNYTYRYSKIIHQ